MWNILNIFLKYLTHCIIEKSCVTIVILLAYRQQLSFLVIIDTETYHQKHSTNILCSLNTLSASFINFLWKDLFSPDIFKRAGALFNYNLVLIQISRQTDSNTFSMQLNNLGTKSWIDQNEWVPLTITCKGRIKLSVWAQQESDNVYLVRYLYLLKNIHLILPQISGYH